MTQADRSPDAYELGKLATDFVAAARRAPVREFSVGELFDLLAALGMQVNDPTKIPNGAVREKLRRKVHELSTRGST